MTLEDKIEINKYGQDLISVEAVVERFEGLDPTEKRLFLRELVNLITQSKPLPADIQVAIEKSGLRSTFTPCVMLREGVERHVLVKITRLPDQELSRVILLLLALFKTAYRRRFTKEKNSLDKWWYWDLSDPKRLSIIAKNYN